MRTKPHKSENSADSSKAGDESISLSPLNLKGALAGLLAVKPPPDEQPSKRKKKKDLTQKRES